MKKEFSLLFTLLLVLFSGCLIVSNFFETKLIQLGPVTATAGLMLFPITYIINDVVAEVWGFRRVRMVIWAGFAMNSLIALFCLFAIALPPAPFWDGEAHFNYIFGLTPRIAVASLTAFLIGSFVNAYVMSRMKVASKGRNFNLRAVVSTLLGEGTDSLIFFPIAFYGLVPNDELLLLIGTQAAMKTAYEILVLPLTNIVVKRIKKVEHTDVFDKNISYNILKLKDL